MAKARPDQTIVIVKLAVGGTSALAWSPTWSAEQARGELFSGEYESTAGKNGTFTMKPNRLDQSEPANVER